MKQQQRECVPREAYRDKWPKPGPPGAEDKLRRFIGDNLRVWVPNVKVCGHHAAPMDYLWYAYSRDRLCQERKKKKGGGVAATETHSEAGSFGHNCRRDARAPSSGDCVVWANRAGGKTQLAAIATLLEGLFKPTCQTRILAGSLAQSQRMYGYLCDFVGRRFAEHLDGKLMKESCRFVNGAAVELLAQSSRAVRGQHVQKLRCDEIELFDEEVLAAAQFITQSSDTHVAAMEIFSTMHRPYGLMQKLIDDAYQNETPVFKWCMWEVIERCPRDRSCSRCALNEDCRGKARRARGYLRIDDCISQMRRASRAGFESEMLCLRPNMENAVFADFDEAVHVQPAGYDPTLPLYRAMDFGFTNPFVCLWIQVDRDGVVRVIDEYVQEQRVIALHGKVVLQRTPCAEPQVAGTFVDPSGNSRNGVSGTSEVKVLRDMGMRVSFCTSDITEGIEKIRAAVRAGDGTSRLVISPQCKELIKAMRCYHYPDGAAKTGSELPCKDGIHDHPIDALRYFFVNVEKKFGFTPITY